MPIGSLGSGELNWHRDQSCMQEPATCAVLHAIEAPENGPKKPIGRTLPSRMRAYPIQQNESSKVKEVYLVMQNA